MPLFTTKQAKDRFEKLVADFVNENNLSDAVANDDKQKVFHAAKSSGLSQEEIGAIMRRLFPFKPSTSNTHTKGKRLNADMVNRVDGNKLSTRPQVTVRKHHLAKRKVKAPLTTKLDSSRGDLTPVDAADAALVRVHEESPVKVKVLQSTSGDVIYNPCTQSTQYSARKAVKLNLERRIPGAVVTVHDVGGDGLVRLSLSMEYEVEDMHVEIRAKSLASPSDMTITQATVVCNDQQLDIDPVDQARTPEDTAIFLKRLAANCALGA